MYSLVQLPAEAVGVVPDAMPVMAVLMPAVVEEVTVQPLQAVQVDLLHRVEDADAEVFSALELVMPEQVAMVVD